MLAVGVNQIVDDKGNDLYNSMANDTPTRYEQKKEKQQNEINNRTNAN